MNYRLLIHQNGGTPKYWAKSEGGVDVIYGTTRNSFFWSRLENQSKSTVDSKLAKGYQSFGVITQDGLDVLTGRSSRMNQATDDLLGGLERLVGRSMPSLAFQIGKIRERARPKSFENTDKQRAVPALAPSGEFDPLTDW